MSTYTIRTPADAAAAAPVLLGFHPANSLVMITVGPVAFHARVDLPSYAEQAEVVQLLLDPCVQHATEGALFLIYSPDPNAWDLEPVIAEMFDAVSTDVLGVHRVAGDRVYADAGDDYGTVYQTDSALLVDAIVNDGRVVGGTREEVAARVAYSGTAVSPIDLAGLEDSTVRDRVWAAFAVADRETAEVWQRALRAVGPGDPLLPHVAAVAALAQWLAGDGAMAWACLDRSPVNSNLGELVTSCLNRAIPPSAWAALTGQV